MQPDDLSMQRSENARTWLGWVLLGLAAVLVTLTIAVPSIAWGAVRSSAKPAELKADTVFVTSGLTWADVTAENTPNIACFAQKSGVAGLALSSGSTMPTKRQGVLSLETGERTDPIIQARESDLARLGALGEASSASSGDALDVRVASQGGIAVINLGDVTPGSAGTQQAANSRRASLARLDSAFAATAGPCGEEYANGTGHRAALASVGAIDPAPGNLPSVEHHRGYAGLATSLNLQVYIDSGWPAAYLTSPSTRQVGTILSTDLAATLTGQAQVGTGREALGTVVAPTAGHSPAVARAQSISLTSRLTEDSLAWVLTGIVATIALLAALATKKGPARFALAALCVSPLAIVAALASARIPLPTLAAHGIPAPLALGAFILLATALMGTLVHVGARTIAPHSPTLGLALATLTVPAAICLDSALGSYSQFTSVLGNQPIYGGRFYGITNHLSGIMLACWALGIGALIHALPIFRTHRRAALHRVLLVGITGATLGAVSILPQMGADAGSALIYAPVTLVACLAVGGFRLKLWHVFAALGLGVGAFVIAGIADYMRPVSARTHLGELVASIIEQGSIGAGATEFFHVFADRTLRMLEPLWLYSPLLIVPALVAGVALTVLALRRRGFARHFPFAYRVRACALAGAWIGALTNDTGLVLVGLAYLFGALLSVALWLCAKKERASE